MHFAANHDMRCTIKTLVSYLVKGALSMLELFRAAGAILLACDVIISERAGTQVGKCGRVTIFRQARVSMFSETQQAPTSIIIPLRP